MQITIDEAQQFIISELQKSPFNSTLSNLIYDVSLETAVVIYMQKGNLNDNGLPIFNDDERRKKERYINDCKNAFSDALWDLCRKGILRPGVSYINPFVVTALQAVNEGYAITEYGKRWLAQLKNADFLPANPERLSELFSSFQQLYGSNYFRRAKEAISSFHVGNYLACCVMCGAAIESILLFVAFSLADRKEVLKKYLSSRGRTNIEKMIFGNAPDYIKNNYSKYTDIINYWRDESAHGHESEIDIDEAYIALLTLLRFAEFIRDNLEKLKTSYANP